MLGSAVVRPTKPELAMRSLARRSVVALRATSRGDKFTDENIGLRRPGDGLPPQFLDQLLDGCAANNDIAAGTLLTLGDIEKC